MKRRSIFYYCILAFFAIRFAQAQPEISYVIPDLGAPGMNTYVEIIGPHDRFGNFGEDGLYFQSQDVVQIKLEEADKDKIVVGPIIVGWQGRMISTQFFVKDDAMPNPQNGWDDFRNLPEEYIIRFKVVVNGVESGEGVFYIVKPFAFPNNSLETALGEGELGVRSPGGAMLVEEFVMNDREYTVSLQDAKTDDAILSGYLPFTLLAKGEIRGGGASSKIVVSGGYEGGFSKRTEAGPGGGGGAGNMYENKGGKGVNGGSGFTGGAPGGKNDATGIDYWGGNKRSEPGDGSGGSPSSDILGGSSANGVSGGDATTAYESSGGGTGHPFGVSGRGCDDYKTCNEEGQFGGGSGIGNNEGGGGGGFGSFGVGEGVSDNNGGKAHGNMVVVPIAGGSGGASGNPNYFAIPPFEGGQSGEGGGGGGAVRLYANEIRNITVEANGAQGGYSRKSGDNNDCVGGGGSGGHVGIFSKLGSQNLTYSALGGWTNPDDPAAFVSCKGGAGRVRFDSPFNNNLSAYPDNPENYGLSVFRGITTDTTRYIYRTDDKVFGSQSVNGSSVIKLLIKPESSGWEYYDQNFQPNTENWEYDLDFSAYPNDSIFYFVAVYQFEESYFDGYADDEFAYIPEFFMSQAAANIFEILKAPKIAGDTLITDSLIVNCPGDSPAGSKIRLKAKIFNEDEGILNLRFHQVYWENGAKGFELASPLTSQDLALGDTARVEVDFTVPDGLTGHIRDTLFIYHNDRKSERRPWSIVFDVRLDTLALATFDCCPSSEPIDTLDFGVICGESANYSNSFSIVNNSSIATNIEIKILPTDGRIIVNPISPAYLPIGVFAKYEAVLDGGGLSVGKYNYIAEIYSFDCDAPIDSLPIKFEVGETDIKLRVVSPAPPDTIKVKVGDVGYIKMEIENIGSMAAKIEQDDMNLNFLQPEDFFSIENISFPFIIPSGESRTFDVGFEPLSAGVYGAELTAVSTLGIEERSCVDEESVEIYGIGLAPDFKLSRKEIVFDVQWCETAEDTVNLINMSELPLTISGYAAITGADAQYFSIVEDGYDTKPVLEQNDTALYKIRFDHNGLPVGQTAVAALEIPIDDPTSPVACELYGTKDSIDISVNPAPIDYGSVAVNSQTERKLTITNNSENARNIVNIIYESDIAINPLTASIPGGASTTFDVGYTPRKEGANLDSVKFVFGAPCYDTLTVYLEADGIFAEFDIPEGLNIGVVPPCQTKTASFIISNTGDVPFTIEDIWLEDESAFQLQSKNLPQTLSAKGDYYTQIIVFDPVGNPEGRNATICHARIFANGKYIDTTLTVSGTKDSGLLSVPENPVDFGDVFVGTTKTMEIDLINESELEIELQTLIEGALPNIFNIKDKFADNSILSPDETLESAIVVEFAPAQKLLYRDTLKIPAMLGDACQDTFFIFMLGNAQIPSSVTLKIPKMINVSPTERNFKIPIFGVLGEDSDPVRNAKMSLIVTFKGSMFYPDEVVGGQMVTYTYGELRAVDMVLSDVDISESDSLIAEISGAVLLGSQTYTNIAIMDATWQPEEAINSVKYENGLMTIDICRRGGDRLLKQGGPVEIFASPNPAGDRIDVEISVIEIGEYELSLLDVRGVELISRLWRREKGGAKIFAFSFDLSEFASGTTFLKLQTPAEVKVKPIFIIK